MPPMMAVGVVIDRPTAARITDDMMAMGGAWGEMFEIWHRSQYAYLTLLAHTKKRIRLRAPLVFMAADDDGLRTALTEACERLDAMRCSWALFIERGSTAEQIIRQQLLTDSMVEGHS